MYFLSINSVWTNSNKAYVINPMLLVREDFDMLEYQDFDMLEYLCTQIVFALNIKNRSLESIYF